MSGAPRTVAEPSLRTASLRGAVFLLGGSLGTKACTIGTQIVLGWLLSEGDFAVYGIAISLTVMTSALSDGGVQKYLRQQTSRYRELVGSAFVLAAALGSGACIVVGLLGWLSPGLYGTDQVRPVALALAANLLFNVPTVLMRTRLAIDLRFRDLAIIDTGGTVLRSLLMVVMAWQGWGALSLALPIPIATVAQAVALAAWGGTREFNLAGVSKASMWSIFRSTRWIMLAAVFGTIVLRGDYLVLGIVAPAIVGTYFFGFQLAASTMQVATMSAASVLLPTLARVASQPDRLRGGVERAMRLSSQLIAPASAVLFLSMPLAIRFIWQGRWDGAIPVAEAVSLSTGLAGLGLIAGAGIEAAGRWKLKAMIDLFEGITLVAMLLLLVHRFGDSLEAISLAVAMHRAVFGMIMVACSGRSVGASAISALRWVLRPVILTGIAVLMAMAAGLPFDDSDSALATLVKLAAFGLVWGISMGREIRSTIGELRMLRTAI